MEPENNGILLRQVFEKILKNRPYFTRERICAAREALENSIEHHKEAVFENLKGEKFIYFPLEYGGEPCYVKFNSFHDVAASENFKKPLIRYNVYDKDAVHDYEIEKVTENEVSYKKSWDQCDTRKYIHEILRERGSYKEQVKKVICLGLGSLGASKVATRNYTRHLTACDIANVLQDI